MNYVRTSLNKILTAYFATVASFVLVDSQMQLEVALLFEILAADVAQIC
jgi:hypothetical protein